MTKKEYLKIVSELFRVCGRCLGVMEGIQWCENINNLQEQLHILTEELQIKLDNILKDMNEKTDQ